MREGPHPNVLDANVNRALPPIFRHIRWHRNPWIASLVANRRVSSNPQRHNSSPDRQSIIFCVIFHRPSPHLRGNLRKPQPQNTSSLQLLLTRLPSVIPTPRQNLLRKSAQRLDFLHRRIQQHGLPERHHRPIIHRVIEHRPRQHQSIHKRNGDAHRDPSASPAQHPASRRPMKIDRIPNPRIHSRNNVRLPLDGKSHVTNKSLIQNFVDRRAVINPAMRFTHHTSALIRCKNFRHDSASLRNGAQS
jgi:hypothetical protein